MLEKSFKEILDENFHDLSSSVIEKFSKHYLKKDLNNLTIDDNLEIDSFGMYGMTEWLIENNIDF